MQGSDELEEKLKRGDSSPEDLYLSRIENARWRLWYKEQNKKPRFRRRRYVCLGLLAGIAPTAALARWLRPEPLEESMSQVFAFLNATFNTSETEKDEEDMPGLLLSKHLRLKHPVASRPSMG